MTDQEKARQAYLLSLRHQLETAENSEITEARGDFRLFCQRVIKDEVTQQRISLADIHLSWIRHIRECWIRGLHAFILAPYGHGKTQIVGIALPLFMFGIEPRIRIKLVSANDDIARTRLGLIRRYIENDEDYREIFPNVRPSKDGAWTKSKLSLSAQLSAKDASLEACGATSSIVGARADLIVFDDINDARNTIQQPKLRETVWQNMTGLFLSRLDSGARIVGIATRWHERDAVGSILADEKMRQQYGILIQRINQDCSAIDCEILMGRGSSIVDVPTNFDQKVWQLYEAGAI